MLVVRSYDDFIEDLRELFLYSSFEMFEDENERCRYHVYDLALRSLAILFQKKENRVCMLSDSDYFDSLIEFLKAQLVYSIVPSSCKEEKDRSSVYEVVLDNLVALYKGSIDESVCK